VRDAALVALARILTSLACLGSGFRAISDDDYSRVVIAARFAQHPSPDPSGTSWLPVPFWMYGIPMALFGDSLLTARVVALLLGAGAAVLVWLSGRLLGLTHRAALGAGLAAVVVPYGAWLSAAMVPEAPTAALLLFGLVTLLRPELKWRAAGGVALGAACFSRYEAWPPALVFTLFTAVDAVRARRRDLGLSAAVATLPIFLWLLHGVVRHGDALFFVARVSQYRAALGREPQGWLEAVLSTPTALVRFEPELFVILLVALALGLRRGSSPFASGVFRPAVALGALVAFLMAADVTGGAATHHPERSLLPVFWFFALLAAGLWSSLAHTSRWPLAAAITVPLVLAGFWRLRPELRSTFANRDDEERIGAFLRQRGARDVALDTDDYGYFAIQAALGYGKSFALTSHDPRERQAPVPTTTPALSELLRNARARWLVLPNERAAMAAPLGDVQLRTARFEVLQLK